MGSKRVLRALLVGRCFNMNCILNTSSRHTYKYFTIFHYNLKDTWRMFFDCLCTHFCSLCNIPHHTVMTQISAHKLWIYQSALEHTTPQNHIDTMARSYDDEFNFLNHRSHPSLLTYLSLCIPRTASHHTNTSWTPAYQLDVYARRIDMCIFKQHPFFSLDCVIVNYSG